MKKATIALDYTPMDDLVMLNAKYLLRRCGITDLTFIHVVPNYLNMNNLTIDSPNLSEKPIDKLVGSLIKDKVTKCFGDNENRYSIECVILEGSPYAQLINYIKANPTDLLVTGKKHKSKGSGVTARRIAHHIECNVLFITEEVDPMFDKIGVPIDFSDNSVRALKHAISIADVNTMIQPVHVISLPSKDHYLRSHQDPSYSDMYINAAKREYFKILAKNNIDQSQLSDTIYLNDSSSSIAQSLLEFFRTENINMAVMGAKGHNALDSILYGSVAEKFVDTNDVFPTMIIR